MKNRILITGSNSFIGSEIVNYLSRYDYSLIATYRKNRNEFRSKKVKLIKLDLKRKLNLNEKFKVLVHCASVTPANEFRENYYKINFLGFHKLMKLSLKLGCRKFILISTIAVYGKTKKPISEKSLCKGNSDYAKSKLLMENILLRFTKGKKVRAIILRLAQVVGKNSANNYFSDLKKKLKQNKKPILYLQPNKDIFNNVCHVSDLCKNLKTLIEDNKNLSRNEIFNFASRRPIAIQKLKKIILSFTKKVKFKKKQNFEILYNKLKKNK